MLDDLSSGGHEAVRVPTVVGHHCPNSLRIDTSPISSSAYFPQVLQKVTKKHEALFQINSVTASRS